MPVDEGRRASAQRGPASLTVAHRGSWLRALALLVPAAAGCAPSLAPTTEAGGAPAPAPPDSADTGAVPSGPPDTGSPSSDTGCDPTTVFVDADGDGYGEDGTEHLGCGPGTSEVGGDCNDRTAEVSPGAPAEDPSTCGLPDANCDGVRPEMCVLDWDTPDVDLPAGFTIPDVTGDGRVDFLAEVDDLHDDDVDRLYLVAGPFGKGSLADESVAVAWYEEETDRSRGVWQYGDVTGDGNNDVWVVRRNGPLSLVAGPWSGDMVGVDIFDGLSNPMTTDLTGDGQADLVAWSGRGNEEVYVFAGPIEEGAALEDAVLVIDDEGSLYTQYWYEDELVDGDEENNHDFGGHLAPWGDHDGDGVADFVAMDATAGGRGFIGATAGSLDLRVFDASLGGRITPAEATVDWALDATFEGAVQMVVPVGDANEDGYDDAVVSCSLVDALGCVVFGPLGETSEQTLVTRFRWPDPLGGWGGGNATPNPLGDVDGDAVPDVLFDMELHAGDIFDPTIQQGGFVVGQYDDGATHQILDEASWFLRAEPDGNVHGIGQYSDDGTLEPMAALAATDVDGDGVGDVVLRTPNGADEDDQYGGLPVILAQSMML